ncbi:hypothetical protein E1B28_013405 [Marasmius oreades]|uniref:TLC domain-containing protein n=1 Tax=Marasmius oreades TaxID=181124 RepID=A0A9P7UPV6_9AGAR|nr:uncharacterized protein E1B28_013405 [Marasmius oreades]KAG7087439.1 hypothetical protein E1B28_013405 [Marasmius oreades]
MGMTAFEFPGVQALSRTLTPIALTANLEKLPPHLPTLINWFIIFNFVQLVISPIISSLVSTTYPTIKNKQKWHMHIISQVHVLAVLPLVLRCLSAEPLANDKLYGWDDRFGTLNAIAAAYFLWDTLNELILADNLGFVLHGFACLVIYTFTFSPFLCYFATRCLLWESSTFFLNNHWFVLPGSTLLTQTEEKGGRFLDKTKQAGSTLQLVNGILLIAVFFCVRIVHGLWTSYNFWRTIMGADLPFALYIAYCTGNLLLNGLNLMWFRKMIRVLQRRFNNPQKNE